MEVFVADDDHHAAEHVIEDVAMEGQDAECIGVELDGDGGIDGDEDGDLPLFNLKRNIPI